MGPEHEATVEQDDDISAQLALFPPGVTAWDQLLRDGKTGAPWPYLPAEWASVCQLGRFHDPVLQDCVLRVARRYRYVKYLLEMRQATQKAGDELAFLQGTIASVRSALQGLGDDAFMHLVAHRAGGPSKAFREETATAADARKVARDNFRGVRAPTLVQESLTGIEWALDRFQRDNAEALAKLPANRRGRSFNAHERHFYRRLHGLFRRANLGQSQPRGFAEVFLACVRPLGWIERSPEAIEDLGRRRAPRKGRGKLL